MNQMNCILLGLSRNHELFNHRSCAYVNITGKDVEAGDAGANEAGQTKIRGGKISP